MTVLLGLDLAQQVGWARRADGEPIRFGSRPFKFPELGQQLFEYRRWLLDRILELPLVTVIAYELPFVGPRTSQQQALRLQSLAGMTEALCWELRIDAWTCNNSSVKLHWIGTGRVKRERAKAMSIARAIALGFAVENDDEADALGVVSYATHCLGLSGAWAGPLFDGDAR